MKHNYTKLFLILILALGFMLAACGGAEPAAEAPAEAPAVEEPAAEPEMEEVEPAAEEPAAEAEVVVEEPTAEPTDEPVAEPVAEAAPADLDAAFSTFLADMQAYNTIGVDDMAAALAEGDVFLLDVREPGELEEKGWIEGAVNIPLRELADNIEYLPSQDTTILAYCGSGWRCTIATAALEGMGWEDVKCLKGGSFSGWVDAGYPIAEGDLPEMVALNEAEPDPALVKEMQTMLQNVPEGYGGISADDLNLAIAENPDLILIDVRTPGEVEEKGYVDAPNVTFIPLEEFIANKDMWPEALDAPIATYCGSGHRSTLAMSILWAYGYSDVQSLKGGYSAWVEAGYPTIGAPAMAEEDPTQAKVNAGFQEMLDTMAGYNTISLEDTNLALVEDPPPFLLDVRNLAEAEESGHIESAVLIPLRELAQNTQYLPSTDTPIITYCGSGWRATIAMTALKALGYEDVKVMKGGSFSGWVEAGYPIVEGVPAEPMELNAADLDPDVVASIDEMLSSIPEGWGVITADDLNLALAETPELLVIDVRRDEEVAEKGAVEADNITFIPIEDFIAEKKMWPADKDAPIAVYCGSGHRSTMGMTMLWANGFTDVRSLKGGFGGWAEAGYPVSAGTGAEASMEAGMAANSDLDAAFQDMLDTMEGYNTISLEDTNLALVDDPPPFLLDVRGASEAEENGHIESAVLIPLRELAQNIQYLPSTDTPIITYCGSGWRATMAMVALKAMGYEDVKVMKGGSFSGWVEAGYPVIEGVPAEPMELNAAEIDPALVDAMDAWLSAIPEGWGVITADDLNLALVENPDLVLIDVRRDEELAENGVIESENLIHIPLEDFIAQKDMWPAMDDAIVTYCGSGHRSTMAMAMLWASQYEDVRSLKGGFGGWADAGYPVVEYAAP